MDERRDNTTQLSHAGAYLSLALAMMLVGSSVVAGKLMVESFPVFLASALRFIIATVLLGGLLGWRERGFPRFSLRDHAILALQALTGVVLFNVLLLNGLTMTTAVASGIITSTTPAFIALISLLLGERMTRLAMLGIAITIAGIVVVNALGASGESSNGSRPILGGLLVLGAVVCEALFTICGKAVSDRVTPMATATLVCARGAAMLIPTGLWELRDFDPAGARLSGWIAILYTAILVTVGGFVLRFRAVAKVPASTAGVFTGLISISALICAAVILSEPIGWNHLIGVACVLAGIVLVTRPERQPKETNPSVSSVSSI